MIGIFVVGLFITAMVATACGLIIVGIRADKRALDERRPANRAITATETPAQRQ